MTREDPIVAEVRQAKDQCAREAGYDIHELFSRLRAAQQREQANGRTYVQRASRPVPREQESSSREAG